MNIEYVIGDAVYPDPRAEAIIVHCANNVGKWGKGFTGALSRRWPAPEKCYRRWAAGKTGQPFKLGEVQFVHVSANIVVANLIGQDGVRYPGSEAPAPIRYDAVETGLRRVNKMADRLRTSIHMPRIGCGLAGGEWSKIEEIIMQTILHASVTVYDLPT